MEKKFVYLAYGGVLFLCILLRQINPTLGGILLAAGLVHLLTAYPGKK